MNKPQAKSRGPNPKLAFLSAGLSRTVEKQAEEQALPSGGLGLLHKLAAVEKPAAPPPVGGAEVDQAGYAAFDPAADYPVGAHIVLPLNRVIENPLNPRFYYPKSEIQSLAKSLGQNGQLTSVQVYPANADGKFMLKSGHRRVRALGDLGRRAVNVEVVAKGAGVLQEYKEAREINLEHKSQSHFDDAKLWTRIIEQENVGQVELAKTLGLDKTDISKTLSIGELPEDLKAKMAEHLPLFGFTASYLVYGYWAKSGKNETATEKVVNQVIEGRMSTRKLKGLVDAAVRPEPERKQTRALSRAEVKGFANGELKAFDGKLTLQLDIFDDEKRDLWYLKVLGVFDELELQVEKAATNANPPGLPGI